MECFNTPVGKGTGNQGEDHGFNSESRSAEVVEYKKLDSKEEIKTTPSLRCVKVNRIDAAAGFTLITLPCN